MDSRHDTGVTDTRSGAGNRRQGDKLSDRVYGDIVDRIIHGEVAEGQRLPSEEALAQAHGVSRPIVREALARLREDGLIRSHRGAGSFVRLRPDRAMLDFAPLESLADIQRCFEFRIVVESEAARLAALNATPADRRSVATAFALLEQRIRESALGVDADYGFHLAIAHASHNRFFADTLVSLEAPITYGQRLARGLGQRRPTFHLPEVQEEHRRIRDSVMAGDGDEAARCMQAHLGNSRRRVFQG